MIEIDKILSIQRTWREVPDGDEASAAKLAVEAFSRCSETISILQENLAAIGYPWVEIEPISSEMVEKNVLTIHNQTGLDIPEILVAFWKLVGGVSFVDLESYEHVEFWKEHGIVSPSGFCDGLHVDPGNDDWAAFSFEDFHDWIEFAHSDDPADFLISLSPDGFHKDNISGGAPYGIYAGSNWKPVWENFIWSGARRPVTALTEPPDFLSYLRTTILECAGFPAFSGVAEFEPLKQKLLRGVPVF
jgi:hypothetical protein